MRNDTIKYKHPYTIWELIKLDIEIIIVKGILNTGDKVPSINQISKKYNVSTSTAQKALESMLKEGTITKRKGVGYFVKPYKKESLRNKHLEDIMVSLDLLINHSHHLYISKEDVKKFFLKRIDLIYNNWFEGGI